MENKSINRLYELVQSDATLKNRLLQIDKRYGNKELTYENFLDVVNNNIIPIAKEYGIALTQEDVINKTKAGLNKISDEDLLDVSGGFSPKAAALTLSTIFLMSLGSGSISSVSAMGSSGETSSPSSSVSSGIRSTSKGLLSVLKSLPSSLKLGIQKMASLFKQKEAEDEEISDRDSYTPGPVVTKGTRGSGTNKPMAKVTSNDEGSGSSSGEEYDETSDNSFREVPTSNLITNFQPTIQKSSSRHGNNGYYEHRDRVDDSDKIGEKPQKPLSMSSFFRDSQDDELRGNEPNNDEKSGTLLSESDRYDETFKPKLDNEKRINNNYIINQGWPNSMGIDYRTDDSSLVPSNSNEFLDPMDFTEVIDPLDPVLNETTKETEQGYSHAEMEQYCQLILDSSKGKNLVNAEEFLSYAKSFCKEKEINYEKFESSLKNDKDLRKTVTKELSKNMKKLLNEILAETKDYLKRNPIKKGIPMGDYIDYFSRGHSESIKNCFEKHPNIKEKFTEKYNKIVDVAVKKADKKDSRDKAPAPVKEKKSKDSQTESKNMLRLLRNTLKKIKSNVVAPPNYTRTGMEAWIKFVEPDNFESIIGYLKNNADIRHKFERHYEAICGETRAIDQEMSSILGSLSKKGAERLTFDPAEDAETKLSDGYKNYPGLSKKFRHDINELYKIKISSILRREDEGKNIRRIAVELFNNTKVEINFVKKAKALGLAKDTEAQIAHRHGEANKGKHTSAKGHSGHGNKEAQEAKATPKQQEKLKGGEADDQKRHHRSSKDSHGQHIHAAAHLNYAELLEIAQSAIQGLAVGDAAGVPFEFHSRDKVKEYNLPTSKGGFTKPEGQLGWWGGGRQNPRVKQGFWSDDTSMTLCLMSSIVDNNGKIVPNDVMERFVKWASGRGYAPEGYRFDIGRQVEEAVGTYTSLAPDKGGVKGTFKAGPNKSAGNGALMRIMPMAFYLAAHPEINESDGVKLIKDIAELTHNDVFSDSDVGCVIYTLMNKNLILDKTEKGAQEKLKDAFDKAIESTKALCREDLKRTKGTYERLLKGYDSFKKVKMGAIDEGNGFTPVTLESVMYSLMHSEKYTDCIRTAILMGFDTDTVASIAGGTAGILYKLDGIPTKWKEKLAGTIDEKRKPVSIEQCTQDFIKAMFLRKKK